MSSNKEHTVAIIVPTLNEVENINLLLNSIFDVAHNAGFSPEVLIADGGSTDGTQAQANQWSQHHTVRLIESDGSRGLAGDVLYAASCTDADIVVVMDADLSHPVQALPKLLEPLLAGTHDMAIGSRYIRGGSVAGWPLPRKIISRVATLLSWPLVSARDPMSGYFAIFRHQFLEYGKSARGFKIGLEILSRSDDSLRVQEVPIQFVDRTSGQSKMGTGEIYNYIRQITRLAGGSVSASTSTRFCVVGALGVCVDYSIFNILLSTGYGIILSHMVSFFTATIINFILNSQWSFASTIRNGEKRGWNCYLRFLFVCILAMFMRGAILESFLSIFGWSPKLAILPAIASATIVNYFGTSFFIFPEDGWHDIPAIRWRVFALAVIGYTILLRFAFAGIIDLIPEEAYYWNYSQHINIGYLDHPPMVAWLIWGGTHIFGVSEFGVRFPAIICWLVAGFFVYRLAAEFLGKTIGLCALMLFSIFPIYFSVGFMMTPDAPMYAAWAGCIYFLKRIFFDHYRWSWIGFGICLGLGMLSKYTIALLGPSVLLFMIVDSRSRQWFFRPGPYLSLLIAVILFCPVIIWNMNHDWASFVFQGPRRWSGPPEFSLHLLLGSIFIILTPLGAIGVFQVILPQKLGGSDYSSAPVGLIRIRLFSCVFALMPFSVFFIHSLQDNPKLNWTGPVWFSVLPLLAYAVTLKPQAMSRIASFGYRLWKPTFISMLLLLGGGFYTIVITPPGLPIMEYMDVPVAWEEMMDDVAQIVEVIPTDSQPPQVIVGLQDYFITAECAFYNRVEHRTIPVRGKGIFGYQGLMWDYWYTPAEVNGCNILILSFKSDMLKVPRISQHFSSMGEISCRPIEKNGRVVGQFFYCMGYNYHADE